MLLILLPFLFTSASGEVYGPFLLFQSYIFLVMYNALLVYADLVSRHLIAVPTCPMCHSQSETLDICFSEVFLLKFCSELYDLLVYQVISLLLWVFPIFCNSGISYQRIHKHLTLNLISISFLISTGCHIIAYLENSYLISYFYWPSHYSIFGKVVIGVSLIIVKTSEELRLVTTPSEQKLDIGIEKYRFVTYPYF